MTYVEVIMMLKINKRSFPHSSLLPPLAPEVSKELPSGERGWLELVGGFLGGIRMLWYGLVQRFAGRLGTSLEAFVWLAT